MPMRDPHTRDADAGIKNDAELGCTLLFELCLWFEPTDCPSHKSNFSLSRKYLTAQMFARS